MQALLYFQRADVFFSGATLAIGVGEAGMRQVDDVAILGRLYRTLRMCLGNTKDIVLWLLVAHMLVRPAVVDAMRNIVGIERIVPTCTSIREVVTRLDRVHGGIVKSRLAGTGIASSWQQVDTFGATSVHALGAKYCGSRNLHKQLKQYDRTQ